MSVPGHITAWSALDLVLTKIDQSGGTWVRFKPEEIDAIRRAHQVHEDPAPALRPKPWEGENHVGG